jgi:hypothetical protein
MTRIGGSWVDLHRFLCYTGAVPGFRMERRNQEETVVLLQVSAVALLG